LQIAQTQAAQEKTNVIWKYSLAVSYNKVGWILAAAPDPLLRDGSKAIEYATKSCELVEWKDPKIIETLAAAYAETKDFKRAIYWENIYLELKPSDKDGFARLALYQKGEPYHVEMKTGR
jgi:TPR repeat protein